MMWIIGILTFFLLADCLFLVLLVLVQLPKKEAGMGQAFGGAATDALFGAGSGNALTKMTKYATVIFFVLTLGLSVLNAHQKRGKSNLEKTLQSVREPAAMVPPSAATNTLAATNKLLTPPANTNAPATTNLLSIPPAAEKGK